MTPSKLKMAASNSFARNSFLPPVQLVHFISTWINRYPVALPSPNDLEAQLLPALRQPGLQVKGLAPHRTRQTGKSVNDELPQAPQLAM